MKTGHRVNWLFVVKKRRPPKSRPKIVDLWFANTKLPPPLLGSVGSVRTFGADAAPRIAHGILIIDAEPGLILRWRRLAARVSPRTAAEPRHSCGGHRCVGR